MKKLPDLVRAAGAEGAFGFVGRKVGVRQQQ